jgi:archaellum component FlaC
MSEDIKNAVSEIGHAFEEFKKANDEKLEALEKGQNVDILVDSKLDAIEEKLNSLEDINQEITQAKQAQEGIKEQVEQLETVMKRPNSGYEAKQVDETLVAFEAYCRKGLENLDDAEKKSTNGQQ